MRKGTAGCLKTTCQLEGIYIRVLPLLNLFHFFEHNSGHNTDDLTVSMLTFFYFKKMTWKEWINCLRSLCPHELRHDGYGWLCLHVNRKETPTSHTGPRPLGPAPSIILSEVLNKVFRPESFQPLQAPEHCVVYCLPPSHKQIKWSQGQTDLDSKRYFFLIGPQACHSY